MHNSRGVNFIAVFCAKSYLYSRLLEDYSLLPKCEKLNSFIISGLLFRKSNNEWCYTKVASNLLFL